MVVRAKGSSCRAGTEQSSVGSIMAPLEKKAGKLEGSQTIREYSSHEKISLNASIH